jgi:RNA polymerase sigma-70 factor (ECF subfamily)
MTVRQNESNRRQWVLAALADYEGRLMRYARRMLRDEEGAKDAVQHTFLRLCDETADSLDGRLAAWLFTVCRNKAVDLAKAAGRTEPLDAGRNGHGQGDREPLCPEPLGREPDPAEAAESGELCRLLRRLVDDLPDNQREAIDLWAEGFSHREIGTITGHDEGNVRITVHRALTKLRNHASVRRWLRDPDTSARRGSPTPPKPPTEGLPSQVGYGL